MLEKIDQMLAANLDNKLTQALALGMLGNINDILKKGLAEYRETVRKEYAEELAKQPGAVTEVE